MPHGDQLFRGFQVTGQMMYALRLDRGNSLYALGFRFSDMTQEPWTARFLAVKGRQPRAMRASAVTMAEAVGSLDFRAWGRVVLVGAISSQDETLAAGAPVSLLCNAISQAKGWEWKQDILRKRRHRSIHTLRGGAAQRDAEVNGVYSAAKIGGAVGTIAIVDDFTTRGSTASDIERAVTEANPGWRYLSFALGKNEKAGYLSDGISNAHVPPALSAIWDSVQ